jgi:hypothetical protein
MDAIFVIIIGRYYEVPEDPKIKLVYYSSNINECENPTIKMIKYFSSIVNYNINILYMNVTSSLTYPQYKYLEHFLIEKYEVCISELEKYNVIGAKLSFDLVDSNNNSYFGNYWWSKTYYIKKLPELNTNDPLCQTSKWIIDDLKTNDYRFLGALHHTSANLYEVSPDPENYNLDIIKNNINIKLSQEYVKTRKIYGLYFISCINNYLDVVKNKIGQIVDSGLYDISDKIICFVCNEQEECITYLMQYKKIKIISTEENLYENFCINNYKKFISKEYYVYYINSKDVTTNENCITDWTNYCNYFTINKWRLSIELLKYYDCVGVNLKKFPKNHYSGNFWWSKSEHINQLKDVGEAPLESDMYILSDLNTNYVSIFQSNTDHLTTTYPSYLYTNVPDVDLINNICIIPECNFYDMSAMINCDNIRLEYELSDQMIDKMLKQHEEKELNERKQREIEQFNKNENSIYFHTINHNSILNNKDIHLNIDILQVYVITNIKSGGTFKYVKDVINTFSNKYTNFINIQSIDELNRFNITQNSIIFVQQLLYANITIEDLILVEKTFGCKLMIVFHDFSILSDNYSTYTDHTHNLYLHSFNYKENIQKLFNISKLIFPSEFIKNEVSNKYTLNEYTVVNHIDTISTISKTAYIPCISNNIINIVVPTELSTYKGKEYIYDLIKKFNTYIYNNNLYYIKFLLFISPNQTEIIKKIKSYTNIYIHEPYNSDNFNNILHKFNIHLILHLNKWGETYGYALSHSLNTCLPIVYSNIGAYKERIPETSYYFKVNPDNHGNINIYHIYGVFNNALMYIINNINYNVIDKVQYNIIPQYYYDLFTSHINTHFHNLYKLNNTKYDEAFKIVQPYAIYFPQFHEIVENNHTFYKGFHDNNNLEQIKKKDSNIQTPINGLLGYYDLKYNQYIIDTQINIAKAYGFRGFGIYYYWFSKNTITNKNKIFDDVIDTFFKDPISNFDVFFIYANEMWSNNPAFNSSNNNCHSILNNYDEHNISHFANNIMNYFKHSNYRKIDNKPVFLLHHPYEIPEDKIDLFYNILNQSCLNNNFNGVHFIINGIYTLNNKYNTYYHHLNYKRKENVEYLIKSDHRVVDYAKYVNDFVGSTENEKHSIIKSCFTQFNNCVRLFKHKDANKIYTSTINCNADFFQIFVHKQLEYYKSNKNSSEIEKIMLFNAWNEWGEQMVLEPSNELGFLYLNIIKDALLNL